MKQTKIFQREKARPASTWIKLRRRPPIKPRNTPRHTFFQVLSMLSLMHVFTRRSWENVLTFSTCWEG